MAQKCEANHIKNAKNGLFTRVMSTWTLIPGKRKGRFTEATLSAPLWCRDSEPNQGRSPGEPGAKSFEQEQLPTLNSAIPNRGVEGKWDRSARRVGMFVDGNDNIVH
jgi:hypothetical protein